MTTDADIDAYFAEVASGTYSNILQLELNLLERRAANR